ncbi:TIGR00725 family protein [Candidatus Haliotispira prima]|uniref:TIGR00725 family protein n=1 Tax=Candidatus Haliotispira prima TaxID=3034016 RepID=A0ABY8MF00_9SPIO|nr:TIGR00725 family protein [Candidatus Haliotispira prima]
MKQIIAIIGNANIEDDIKKQKISFELGKLIINNGFILATGGLGGVMEYASKGAKTSKKYTENSIIGVLPDYNSDNANKYIDIAIPTGFGLARNLMLISMANAVIAVGGGSGTLNEISASWQMNKLIIGLQVNGWSQKLCGNALDERRNDIIYCAKNAQEAIEVLNNKISYYQIQKFTGISKPIIKKNKAKQIVIEHFKPKIELEFLGNGNEGFVFTDKNYVYKLIDKTEQPLELYWTLLSLSETLKKENSITAFPQFEVSFLDNQILIKYKYEQTNKFIANTKIHIDKFIELLKQFRQINWTLTDFKPQNLRITEQGDLLVIDLGKSFLPISDYLFRSMCCRAFVTYKLQEKLSNPQDFKKYLLPVNEKPNFSLMTEFNFVEDNLIQEFNAFYKKVTTVDKKDILNPIIKSIFSNLKINSVFDYGSGYGDMSKLLQNINLSITAYEPDEKVVEKYKKKYYQNVKVLDYVKTKKLIISKVKFDSVLCSLVLCYPLAESKEGRLEIINQIMRDITALTNKYVVMVVCNPLYTYQICSTLQKRILPDNFDYKSETKFIKRIYSSGRERFDVHRPLSFYENLFEDYNFNIKEIIQTNDNKNTNGIHNSDFLIFVLEKGKQKDKQYE